ncbi:tetratricopeptide repeat protein [Nautilia lithotrophica]
MKIRYILIYTILTISYINAYEIKQPEVIEYNKKREYKKLINLANKYALENKIDESLQTAKKALNYNPKSKEALLIMARIYNFKKDYEKLRLIAEKIVKLSPKNYLGNVYLANSYMKKDKNKAKEILVKLLNKYPKDEQILKKLKVLNET